MPTPPDLSYPELRLFIGGEWRGAAQTLPVVNPSTEAEIGRLPVATPADLDDALAAAESGFATWRHTSPRDRADLIRRAAALMRERQDEIAHSITLEHGKPFQQARLEVIRGAEFFEWDAGEATRTYGRVIPSAPGVKYIVHHQPIGPVAAFAPWNFPMSQPARKVAGALASGCSIILKASEETPAGAIHIAKAFDDAGLPAGVLNLVFGVPADISSHLIPDERIRLVAFTGSTGVGRHLTGLASQHMTPVLMELGGHAPVIVCEDTDVDAAAVSSAIRAMRNAGQVCTSPTRFFVHEQIYDQFLTGITAKRRRLSAMGSPTGSRWVPSRTVAAFWRCRNSSTMPPLLAPRPPQGEPHWRCGLFLRADGARRRPRPCPNHARRAVRAGRHRQSRLGARRGDCPGQFGSVRACGLRLHQRS